VQVFGALVQAITVDNQNHLWILDPAAPANAFEIPSGPKLMEINLATNTVMRTILFSMVVAPQGSYLNDVRFSPDGQYAYITDSGIRGPSWWLICAVGQPAAFSTVTHARSGSGRSS